MRKLSIIGMMLVCGAAWAQTPAPAPEKKEAPPKASEGKPEAKPKAPAAMKAPEAKPPEMKPAPELKQEYGAMIGNWKCQGKGSMMGKEMTMTGTYRAEWKLDGYIVVANYEAKAAGMPGTHKGMDIYGYDPASKMFTSTGFDSMGGSSTAKSKGFQGDTEEWTGTGTMMGKSMDVKWTVTKKGDKEVHLKGTAGTDTWEETCKK